ncbi:DinB/UmuC family translesion DNA polymerase [Streptomyces rishiriensis]|uniref:DinB/UmuC family translesion DNA polymerase n=1 Tax=Streptomyces rishiriensis TaxID=68264 RepID=UPI0037D21140
MRELPGVGGKTATLLGEYGLHTVGDVADVPQHTFQRLLGAGAGRVLYEHAQGHDLTVVDATPAPASLSKEHRFPRDELDPAAHRRILLALADDLGSRLRATDQIATGVTCTIRYADLSATRRSRNPARSYPAHRPPGPGRLRGVRLPRSPARPGPQHRAARRRPSAGRPGHPAAHPRRR